MTTASGGTTTTGYVKARHPSGAEEEDSCRSEAASRTPRGTLGHNQPEARLYGERDPTMSSGRPILIKSVIRPFSQAHQRKFLGFA